MQIDQAMIDGVNIKEALQRLRSNTKLYTKLLTHFLQEKELMALEQALQSGDVVESANAAHTLKGTAANLSITSIQERAAALEALLKTADAQIDATTTEMCQSIRELYVTLRTNLQPYLEV